MTTDGSTPIVLPERFSAPVVGTTERLADGVELVDPASLTSPAVLELSSRWPVEFEQHPDVQRSKLWWGYAGSVLRPAAAGLLTAGEIPDVTIDNALMVLDPEEERLTMSLRRHDRVVTADPRSVEGFLETVVDGHLAPIARLVREAFPKVPIRAFWGNAATSWARAVIELIDLGAVDRELALHHIAAVDDASPELGRKGSFVDVAEEASAPVYRYHRRTCCLWLKIDEVEPCQDCTVVPREEWLAIVRDRD